MCCYRTAPRTCIPNTYVTRPNNRFCWGVNCPERKHRIECPREWTTIVSSNDQFSIRPTFFPIGIGKLDYERLFAHGCDQVPNL